MLPPAKTAVVGVHVRFVRSPRNMCNLIDLMQACAKVRVY